MTCMNCLSRFSCSGALVKMYQEEAEKCPYLKNKDDYVKIAKRPTKRTHKKVSGNFFCGHGKKNNGEK